MTSDEHTYLKKAVDEFISNENERFDILTLFQNQLKSIEEKLFHQVIDFVENHEKIFFSNHQNAIFFFFIINYFANHYFQKLEIILDIAIHFEMQLKNSKICVSEDELFDICKKYGLSSINYLFSKGFFSNRLIFQKSIDNMIIFINFLPEIEQYDKEYTNIKEEKVILSGNKQIISFFEMVKSDYKKHIVNRNTNYDPSLLHKSIREDDINSFQSLVSKNNYNLNEPIMHSVYDRSNTRDSDLQPIKIAAVYKSIKIFKFLLMNNVTIDDDLLEYAYFGSDPDIIHLCENLCSSKNVCKQSIYMHNQELLEYWLDNFNDNLEEDEMVKNALQSFDLNENLYNELDIKNLLCASYSYNYPIIISCLKKITFIAQNIELKNHHNTLDTSFLFRFKFDLNIFKFIYSQIKQVNNDYNSKCLKECLCGCIIVNANDASKFLFHELKNEINYLSVFQVCIKYNHHMANYILNLQFEEKESNNTNSVYHNIKESIYFYHLQLAIEHYNEDIVVKMICLYDLLGYKRIYPLFVKKLINLISPIMIYSLFEKLSNYVSSDKLFLISKIFNQYGYSSIANYIKNKISSRKKYLYNILDKVKLTRFIGK